MSKKDAPQKTEYTLKALAELVGGDVIGDADFRVFGIRGVDEAGPRDITFLANPKYRAKVEKCNAGAVIARKGFRLKRKNLLLVEDAYFAFSRIMQLFHPPVRHAPGVHQDSFIAETALVASSVSVYPGVYIGDDTELGKDVVLYPGVRILEDCRIGDSVILYPNVTLYPRTKIGRRTIIHAGSIIGSDGFGYAPHDGVHHKIPQTGGVDIGEDVEIGANVTIDRGTFGDTVIGSGTKIDNLVQIAHNCVLGKNVIIVAMVGLSGSTIIGDNTIFAGQSATAGHLRVGKNVTVTGKTGVTKNIPDNMMVSGLPAIDHRRWKKIRAVYMKLPEVLDRIRKLEQFAARFGSKKGGSAF